VTLPAEAAGSAPGRGRLAGRRVLVVGAGTRPSPEPDPPVGNGRAIAVLAAREGAAVACADRDAGAAEAQGLLVPACRDRLGPGVPGGQRHCAGDPAASPDDPARSGPPAILSWQCPFGESLSWRP